MECEMCGKQAVAIARIEGAQLSVCASCGQHGTVVKQLVQPTKPKKTLSTSATTSSSAGIPKDELIETVRKDTGKLLRQHRERLKLNQEQFAAKLQIRASTYNHYESGATVPDVATARRLEHVLGVPLVVHIKVSGPLPTSKEETRGMTMGDFVKKRAR